MIKLLYTKWGNQRHYYQHLHPKRLKAVFIVSTGRTGTKFVEYFFKAIDPQVYCVHEPQPDFFDLGIQKYRHGQSTTTTVDQIQRLREPHLRSLCAQRTMTYVESNPFASLLLPELLAAFPLAKFIVITRDARTYIRSALNKSPLDDGAFYLYGKKDRRKRISAADLPDDPYRDDWAQWDRRQKIAWYWNWCNHQLLDFAQAHPERSHCVAFEALFSKEKDQQIQAWNGLLDHMNQTVSPDQLATLLEKTKEKKNATQAAIFEGVEAWNPAEQAEFNTLTASAQDRIDHLVHQYNIK